MNLLNRPDIEEFEQIVGRYQNRLFRFAFMRIGIREVAEDMVQDVLIKVFKALGSGGKVSNLEYYLLHSINNACVDYFRKKKPSILSIEEVSDLPNETDRDITEEFRRIKRLLDDLPYEQAETVRLKCYDDLTFRQIAELHNASESAVKARYRYAILKIREKLKGD